jgi:hypothetical protein
MQLCIVSRSDNLPVRISHFLMVHNVRREDFHKENAAQPADCPARCGCASPSGLGSRCAPRCLTRDIRWNYPSFALFERLTRRLHRRVTYAGAANTPDAFLGGLQSPARIKMQVAMRLAKWAGNELLQIKRRFCAIQEARHSQAATEPEVRGFRS